MLILFCSFAYGFDANDNQTVCLTFDDNIANTAGTWQGSIEGANYESASLYLYKYDGTDVFVKNIGQGHDYNGASVWCYQGLSYKPVLIEVNNTLYFKRASGTIQEIDVSES